MRSVLPITLSTRDWNCLSGQSLSRAIYLALIPEKLRLKIKNKKREEEERWVQC